ncbi:carbon-nitrogen hydrolase family protein [Robiginitalea sp. M366]|uniref:carbon-nitrogen hydrolase family protein n=1 Tax=Robiginitalea aestuariiviva TaxID=3036903 RepID=UPI00240DB4F9|nr:carbon-nitrogen hydrolase family protein [Robiginitalea aestuariiviva]MDG1571192.1 carbon-nitrogen hydrolase family protein [Robiginitalea aestuariiviva]
MKVKVAVIQESPAFFDKEAGLQQVAHLCETYAAQGCRLILFPESFIPGYPRGFTFGARVGSRSEAGRVLYAEYHRSSFSTEGKERAFLEEVARKNGIYLAIGVTEKVPEHGSLYCSLLYFSPYTGFMGSHRKLKPTGSERLVWAEGDASGLLTFDTPVGRIGGLICWENYMPLARQAMYRKGVQIYLAPTADGRPGWTATLRHIALEGRCFVLGCNQFMRKDMYADAYLPYLEGEPEVMCPGGSAIISPSGEVLQGPLNGEAGVLVADLDLEETVRTKLDFDPHGHYARHDVFQFDAPGQPEIRKDPDETD